MGRPRGLKRMPLSTSIDMNISKWLDEKENRATVVNTALKELMEKEKSNEVPFLRAKLGELNDEKTYIEKEIRSIVKRIEKIESDEKELDTVMMEELTGGKDGKDSKRIPE